MIINKETQPRHWQKKAIELYTTRICDISFDHISVENREKEEDGFVQRIYHIHELGYEKCPACEELAPIVNLNLVHPQLMYLLCDCGFEAPVNRPQLYRAYQQTQ